MVTTILSIPVAIGAGLAAIFGIKSAKNKSEANLARVNEHLAYASEQAGLMAEKAVSEVEKKHQEEKVKLDKDIEAGKRNGLEGDW